MRILLLATALMLAACSRGGGGDDQSLGAATGNSLTSAQIDAALGPANQQQVLANETTGATNVTEPDANNGERAHSEMGRESNTTELDAETSTLPR